jgi:hypothetical protein
LEPQAVQSKTTSRFHLPLASGLPFIPKGVGLVSIIFEGFVGINGLVEVVIEGFNALDKFLDLRGVLFRRLVKRLAKPFL